MTGGRRILLVEDSDDDVELTRLALDEAGVDCAVDVVTDGEDAMRFLRREGEHGQAPRPDLVLLDLNLPRKSGREVLAEAKADPALRRIPIVVLTTSADDRDVRLAYDLHVNAYVRKPHGFDALVDVARRLEAFWMTSVQLPQPG